MLDPATARLCVWRLPLEAAFRLFSKLGSLGGSIRERFSRTGRTRPALARPAFSRWLLENDRLRERWPCQWLNVLYFPFSETSPSCNLGLCPKPHSLQRPQGHVAKPIHIPWAECWVDSKASRVKCTTASPLTPFHLLGCRKLSEADGEGNLSRLAKQPRSGLAFTGGGDPTICGWGAGVKP